MEKEVYFAEFCPLCKFQEAPENEEPCWTCLNYPSNIDSHKPVDFKPKKD